MPARTKAYLNPDGSGFVHVVGTQYVCPPGTEPSDDASVCVGEPTGRFEPPTEAQVAALLAENEGTPADEALLAPPGFVLPPTLTPFPTPEVLPEAAPKPSPSIPGAAVGVIPRLLGFIGGILWPSDSADADLGITAPPGGFSAEPTPDYRGFVDLNPENSVVNPRASPYYRDSPLPSAFVTPPVIPLFDAPGLPYSPYFDPLPFPEPYPETAFPPVRQPPLAPPRADPAPLDPDEGDFRVDRYPPIPAPLIPFAVPDIFTDPYPYAPPTAAPTPTPTPTFTPVPTITPNPVFNPVQNPFDLPLPTPVPVPRPPQTPRPSTPGPGLAPTITPTFGLFDNPFMYADPGLTPARPTNCPPCVESTPPKKQRKKKQPRMECWKGSYTETSKGLIKNRRERVPCQ